MAPRARPRLVDIATQLDVAPSTVSRALAGSSSVSTATRERVLAAAQELGYTVNPVASGLKRGRTFSIGLIAVMHHWYAGAVTAGADRIAAARGYDFVVMNSAGGFDQDLLFARARRLGNRVDGVLIVDLSSADGVLQQVLDAVGVPAVTLGCRAPEVTSVVVDNVAIGRIAARHLGELGHRDAVVLAFDAPSATAIDNAVERIAGFRSEMGGRPVVRVPRDRPDERRAAIIEACKDATAVFCASDALAIETLALIRQSGRSVPHDVSVIGVDDHPLAQALGLTTVGQSPEPMGERAAGLLIEAINGGTSSSVTVGVELLVRETTARPAASD